MTSSSITARAHSVLGTWWARSVLLATAGLGIVLLPVPICPVRLRLHQPCPGCGVSRAIVLAIEGHFRESIAMHPLALVAVALMVPSFVVIVRTQRSDGMVPDFPRWLRRLWTAFVTLLIVLWIARFFGYFGGPVPV
jgi:hypothetical protein